MTASPAWPQRRLHLVGIGGCGMSGLALVIDSLGATVTGSDSRDQPVLSRLRDRGIGVTVGHRPENVPEGAELVYSSAIRPENPERIRGRQLGLVERRRGELLAELAATRRCIAVAGTHGKTTTSAMTVQAMRGAGIPAGYLIGSDLLNTGAHADWGESDWLVVETDESDRSLLALAPEVAVLTNAELEHVNAYASRDELDVVFRTFLSQAGRAVIWDRPDLLRLGGADAVAFDAPSPQLTSGGSTFSWRGHQVKLRVPGEHNARNAAAALEASLIAGADPARAAAALGDFEGTVRRLQRLGSTPSGAAIYDDFAHHPTEVAATLTAARTLEPGRLVAVLEPHSFLRVGLMAEAFGAALALADAVVVLDVVPASYDRAPVSTRRLADAARAAGCPSVLRFPDLDAAERHLSGALGPEDLCVIMGVARSDQLARRLLAPAAGAPTRGAAAGI